ncbi:MAG: hypothetical protein Ta2A_08370 [Treponemataceae bacterium]|nr:MAG: hypothetical protein Ta2A_08370 [Treponemataceae bacterium]
MAIQPMDLQVLYAQMDKVAKNTIHEQQGKHLAATIQDEEESKRNALKRSAVADVPEGDDSIDVVKERKETNPQGQGGKKKFGGKTGEDESSEDSAFKLTQIDDPNLGQYVDVSG